MRSILVLLEDLVLTEFGAPDLTAVRATATARLADVGRVAGAPGRVMAYAEALAQVRRRPVAEVYQFIGFKLVAPVMAEYGKLFTSYASTRAVLMQVTRLAPQVLDVLIPGVDGSDFDVELLDLDTVRVRFEGPVEMVSAFEGVALGLGQHFGERIEPRAAAPPAFAPERRLVDVKIAAERRASPAGKPPHGEELRRRLGI